MTMRIAGSLPLATAVLLAACSTPRVDVTPRYGTLDVSGQVGISSTGLSAKADVENAGLERDDSVFGLRGDFDWGPLHLMASLQSTNHDGDGTLDAEISGGGVTIPVGADVASELELGLYTAALTFDFVPTDMFELGVGLGLSYVDLEAAFEDALTGERVEADGAAPIPLLAARAGVRFWRLDVSLQGGGLAYSYDGDDLSLLDLELLAKLRLIGGDDHLAGHLAAGYRYVDLAFDYEDGGDDADADLTFQGPFVGLTLSL